MTDGLYYPENGRNKVCGFFRGDEKKLFKKFGTQNEEFHWNSKICISAQVF